MQDKIIVKGARANNLKNIDVTIPRDKLVVMTGLSGSGKSSLAFDTIYAEGQRRYVESLSSYARMFLGQMEKPDVDYIDGLSPAISIDQKTTSKNPRSTVGTVTEIYDYLRLLWARVGTPHCPVCGKEIKQQTIDQIIDQVLELPEATRIQVMAPVIRGKKGEHAKVFEDARRSGYVRCRVDGIAYDLSEEIKLEKNKKHNIEIVVDRLVIREDIARRLTDSVEIASNLSGGLVVVNVVGEDRDILFSQNYACEDCGVSIEELTPRMFSFNNPYGACPACTGLGSQLKVDPELIIPNKDLSILEGAITASGWSNIKSDGIARMYFDALAKKYRFKLDTPAKNLSPEVMDVILYGTRGEELTLHYDQPRGKGTLHQAFEGICNNLERRYKETQSDAMRRELERGGQVYYLHNRVETIDRTAARIGQMLGEDAAVGVAHGKMSQEAIDDVMSRMTDGELNVLVCTTIIETGIDLPNANTLIIEDADHLGLAQLHQIRGRVGRSNRRAFAYLTYRRGKVLTEVAAKRLSAIREFAEFGSGFKIAMRDLEIRGAGNVLGPEQSGFMLSVGYDMYLKLLEEAVLTQQGQPVPKRTECAADLAVAASIPDRYVPAPEQRMDLYRRIAAIRSEEEADDLVDELIDRYGEPPRTVNNLISVALLRAAAAEADITDIAQKNGQLIFTLEQFRLEPFSLLCGGERYRNRLLLIPGDVPRFTLRLRKGDDPLRCAQNLVEDYARAYGEAD